MPGMQGKVGQHGPLTWTAQREPNPILAGFDCPEQPDFHR